MQRTDLVRENKELQGKVDSLADGLVEAINKNTDLEDENRKLRKEISSLNVRIREPTHAFEFCSSSKRV